MMQLIDFTGSENMELILFLWTLKLLLLSYFFYKYAIGKVKVKKPREESLSVFPKVCIQLPIYNEPEHCQELIQSVSELDWPIDQLEIQVLDDSNDQSSELIAAKIAAIIKNKPGINIRHLRRPHRQGYKAGALNHGFQQSKAEYFAIFDCDFRPSKEFLKVTIPHFSNSEKIAAVQVPWGYYNANANIFTWVQSLLLICHFHRDHRGRFERGLIFHFNGTAGVWKASVLQNLGGFSANTVTEDLYLSLKAWIHGYRIWYADVTPCKSELPPTLASFLIQQRRWAKGNGQVLRLLSKDLIKNLPYGKLVKADALLQQFGYGISTFFVMVYFLSPLWINAYGHWLAKSHEFNTLKALDACLWIGVFTSFFLLFFPNNASLKYYTHSLPPLFFRFFLVISLILLAPLFAIFIGFSYWQGLLVRLKKPGHLYFARTPKKATKATLSQRDHRTLDLMIGFAVFCSIYALWWGVIIPFTYFSAQTALLSYLKLNESIKLKSYFHRCLTKTVGSLVRTKA